MARKLVGVALVMAGLVAAVWFIPLALAQVDEPEIEEEDEELEELERAEEDGHVEEAGLSRAEFAVGDAKAVGIVVVGTKVACAGGSATLNRLEVYELESIWKRAR